MSGTLRAGEDHRTVAGDEAIDAYQAWRKRHLSEPDDDGRVAVRLASMQQRKAEISVSG